MSESDNNYPIMKECDIDTTECNDTDNNSPPLIIPEFTDEPEPDVNNKIIPDELKHEPIQITTQSPGTKKLVIVGDTGVGKTSYLSRFVKTGFITQHTPTKIEDIKEVLISFNTNEGLYQFSAWDYAQTIENAVHESGKISVCLDKLQYLKNADCAIIMTDTITHHPDNVKVYQNLINNLCGIIPTICIINKCELRVSSNLHKSPLCVKAKAYVSGKTNNSLQIPFEYLIKIMENNPNIKIIE